MKNKLYRKYQSGGDKELIIDPDTKEEFYVDRKNLKLYSSEGKPLDWFYYMDRKWASDIYNVHRKEDNESTLLVFTNPDDKIINYNDPVYKATEQRIKELEKQRTTAYEQALQNNQELKRLAGLYSNTSSADESRALSILIEDQYNADPEINRINEELYKARKVLESFIGKPVFTAEYERLEKAIKEKGNFDNVIEVPIKGDRKIIGDALSKLGKNDTYAVFDHSSSLRMLGIPNEEFGTLSKIYFPTDVSSKPCYWGTCYGGNVVPGITKTSGRDAIGTKAKSWEGGNPGGKTFLDVLFPDSDDRKYYKASEYYKPSEVPKKVKNVDKLKKIDPSFVQSSATPTYKKGGKVKYQGGSSIKNDTIPSPMGINPYSNDGTFELPYIEITENKKTAPNKYDIKPPLTPLEIDNLLANPTEDGLIRIDKKSYVSPEILEQQKATYDDRYKSYVTTKNSYDDFYNHVKSKDYRNKLKAEGYKLPKIEQWKRLNRLKNTKFITGKDFPSHKSNGLNFFQKVFTNKPYGTLSIPYTNANSSNHDSDVWHELQHAIQDSKNGKSRGIHKNTLNFYNPNNVFVPNWENEINYSHKGSELTGINPKNDWVEQPSVPGTKEYVTDTREIDAYRKELQYYLDKNNIKKFNEPYDSTKHKDKIIEDYYNNNMEPSLKDYLRRIDINNDDVMRKLLDDIAYNSTSNKNIAKAGGKLRYQVAGAIKVFDNKTNQVLTVDKNNLVIYNNKGEQLDWEDFADRYWAKDANSKVIIDKVTYKKSKKDLHSYINKLPTLFDDRGYVYSYDYKNKKIFNGFTELDWKKYEPLVNKQIDYEKEREESRRNHSPAKVINSETGKVYIVDPLTYKIYDLKGNEAYPKDLPKTMPNFNEIYDNFIQEKKYEIMEKGITSEYAARYRPGESEKARAFLDYSTDYYSALSQSENELAENTDELIKKAEDYYNKDNIFTDVPLLWSLGIAPKYADIVGNQGLWSVSDYRPTRNSENYPYYFTPIYKEGKSKKVSKLVQDVIKTYKSDPNKYFNKSMQFNDEDYKIGHLRDFGTGISPDSSYVYITDNWDLDPSSLANRIGYKYLPDFVYKKQLDKMGIPKNLQDDYIKLFKQGKSATKILNFDDDKFSGVPVYDRIYEDPFTGKSIKQLLQEN